VIAGNCDYFDQFFYLCAKFCLLPKKFTIDLCFRTKEKKENKNQPFLFFLSTFFRKKVRPEVFIVLLNKVILSPFPPPSHLQKREKSLSQNKTGVHIMTVYKFCKRITASIETDTIDLNLNA